MKNLSLAAIIACLAVATPFSLANHHEGHDKDAKNNTSMEVEHSKSNNPLTNTTTEKQVRKTKRHYKGHKGQDIKKTDEFRVEKKTKNDGSKTSIKKEEKSETDHD